MSLKFYWAIVKHLSLPYDNNNIISFSHFSAPPGAPNNLVAVQIAYTIVMDRCFFTAIWQRPINGILAEVTDYTVTVSSNGKFKFNKTINVTSDIIESSASFQDTCETDHTINITAGNICGMGPPIMYVMENQGECSELKIEHIPESCYATVRPPTGGLNNKGEIINSRHGKCMYLLLIILYS